MAPIWSSKNRKRGSATRAPSNLPQQWADAYRAALSIPQAAEAGEDPDDFLPALATKLKAVEDLWGFVDWLSQPGRPVRAPLLFLYPLIHDKELLGDLAAKT